MGAFGFSRPGCELEEDGGRASSSICLRLLEQRRESQRAADLEGKKESGPTGLPSSALLLWRSRSLAVGSQAAALGASLDAFPWSAPWTCIERGGEPGPAHAHATPFWFMRTPRKQLYVPGHPSLVFHLYCRSSQTSSSIRHSSGYGCTIFSSRPNGPTGIGPRSGFEPRSPATQL